MDRQTWFLQLSKQEKEALFLAEMENYSEKMVVNMEGRIIFINEKYAAEFRHTPAELEGMLLDDLIRMNSRYVPPILDLPDFASPYVPYADRIQSQMKPPSLIRAPLATEDGTPIGYMLYDGQDWLQRYRSLSDKLSELEDEYQYSFPSRRRPVSSQLEGKSQKLRELKRSAIQAGRSNATVLIEGETGTGKEVVANAIHAASKRSAKPFVKLNCAAIPQELMESELFGYEEGSFTGAKRGGKIGLFEAANHGTILLDEINSLGLAAQAKLLRVLQERVITRVGGNIPIPIDVRVIAISNRSLEAMAEEGLFRLDLFYRLNVLHINVPPLREHPEDIPELVYRFVELCNLEMEKHVDAIDPKIYNILMAQDWPGNVRQLQNWVERAMASVWKKTLTPANFYWVTRKASSGCLQDNNMNSFLLALEDETLAQTMDRLEQQVISTVLKRCGGNKSTAAARLGISRQMLYRKMKKASGKP